MTPPSRSALFWFRRDLRTDDNCGLYQSLRDFQQVYCVFVFDKTLLAALSPDDRRVAFIHACVVELDAALARWGGGLIVLHAAPEEAIVGLATELSVAAVVTNEDYEPYATARDRNVESMLKQRGIAFLRCKDSVIFGPDEVLTKQRGTYSVFTPYKKAWLEKLHAAGDFYHRAYPVEKYRRSLAVAEGKRGLPTLALLGFAAPAPLDHAPQGGSRAATRTLQQFLLRLENYHEARDFPGEAGTSRLSVHNRFGTISIRFLVSVALSHPGAGPATWLSELIWRDFYFQILAHHPRVATAAFKPEYNAIRWENSPELFTAWCEGRTGYPLVDAAMLQLNQSGFMHNRLRMVTASFLTKDLLIDWRWGEAYFAQQLYDFDLAANNGGWQWAASTGCDAQPYFRIFNPVTQSRRFDPDGTFIRAYLPQLARYPDKYLHAPWTAPGEVQQAAQCVIGRDYAAPVVMHAQARLKALQLYRAAKGSAP